AAAVREEGEEGGDHRQEERIRRPTAKAPRAPSRTRHDEIIAKKTARSTRKVDLAVFVSLLLPACCLVQVRPGDVGASPAGMPGGAAAPGHRLHRSALAFAFASDGIIQHWSKADCSAARASAPRPGAKGGQAARGTWPRPIKLPGLESH